MTQPQWDPSDPRASLLAFGEFFHEHARATFLKDGTHVNILFIMAENGTMQPVPIAKPMTNESVADTLREQLPGSNAYGLIHIAEGWGYVPRGRADHTLKQIRLGEMHIADLRDEDKIELLIVSLLSRDGVRKTWLDEIVRQDDAVSLRGSAELTDSRFPLGNVFTPHKP
ncbi:MAG: hypothetical protein E4H02_12015 [Lentisphaerales bacterium]|nr:MAG: hypothetical protein E4H02_12015 [Lentisphaerales bacterium]